MRILVVYDTYENLKGGNQTVLINISTSARFYPLRLATDKQSKASIVSDYPSLSLYGEVSQVCSQHLSRLRP